MIKQSLSKEFRNALIVSILLQIVLGFLAAINLDGGVFFHLWWRAMAGYWAALIVILMKRPNAPTKVDLFLVRWGFIPLFLIITPVLTALMWRLVWSRFLPIS